uniref:Mitochondrial ribosomal protein S18C n=1 Tax=Oryzias latipes TaxID=8090 RepID=A0A3B3HM43_ORYLA
RKHHEKTFHLRPPRTRVKFKTSNLAGRRNFLPHFRFRFHGRFVLQLVKMENPYKQPQRGCILCNLNVDYKNTQVSVTSFLHTLGEFAEGLGCVAGLCGRKQKEVSKAIKKAQALGFMPVTHKHPQFMKDPNICSTKRLE